MNINTSTEYININNFRQNIMTISSDDSNPVLLIVHGGAGSPDRPLVKKYNSELAEYYTVVCWDQRGSGLSYTKENLTIDIMLNDLKSVVEFLRNRYHQDKIYIAGHSWGAYLGLRFSFMHPEYVKYYIGTGQGISSFADEIYKYNFVRKQAHKRNDNKVIEKLDYFGEPIEYTYSHDDKKAKQYIGKMVHKYGGYISDKNEFNTNKYLNYYIKCYKFNIIKVIKGMLKSSKTLNIEMNEKDSISCITELTVPVLLISGEDDMICPVQATQNWFDNLKAPHKEFIKIKNAAHMVNFEQPNEWNKLVIRLTKNNINS
ncbi:alpha/beta fold hydrolase [Eubacterium sp.]